MLDTVIMHQYETYKDDKSNFVFLEDATYLLSILRPMLPSIGGFAVSSDVFFFFFLTY